ncbi:DUF1003 domain-containing protein [Parendozoicomonas haliclonae]|uniref:DUF1003 domain-containing protein n=1 Tax=Parendozoicomonas haliclonae TaxID=1960125 RepID=A0A1X7AIZ4_9GAMM|nr:DUF1003 domain-containing protein [Parendozoicomonas haliclonae]SMA45989.1 hypothetical protein EHSB41UT_02054 [Parendozoicomonas haliclonae]
MKRKYGHFLERILAPVSRLDAETSKSKVLASVASKKTISKNINHTFEKKKSLGDRVADTVATFGGSWIFIGLFCLFVTIWISINVIALTNGFHFDPYPFILLNLGLSILSGFQAPIIMMSQNTHASKDRVKQDSVYEINLKLELEINQMQEKLDAITADLHDLKNDLKNDLKKSLKTK